MFQLNGSKRWNNQIKVGLFVVSDTTQGRGCGGVYYLADVAVCSKMLCRVWVFCDSADGAAVNQSVSARCFSQITCQAQSVFPSNLGFSSRRGRTLSHHPPTSPRLWAKASWNIKDTSSNTALRRVNNLKKQATEWSHSLTGTNSLTH